MTNKPDDRTKELEERLAADMRGMQQRPAEKGFRVDGGNKSPSGRWLTANNRNASRSIEVEQ